MTRLIAAVAPATRSTLFGAAVTAAVSLGGSGLSAAYAQTSGAPVTSNAPVLDAQHPGMLVPAPVGHRQPRRADLPPSVQHNETTGTSTPGERGIDRDLQICREC
jgi:hypothetical protein